MPLVGERQDDIALGDHLGDHGAWQKESFFEPATHIPFLLSWPARLPADVRRNELVCLTDLFGIATSYNFV